MDQQKAKTLCPYCGVGCGLEVSKVDKPGRPPLKVMGDRQHPSSLGKVCVKGATIADSLDKDRLLYPMYRRSLDDPFERVSWDRAFDLIADRIQTVKEEIGVEGVAMYGSGQLQTEDYYTAQKLLKGCLGTNNFDANSRLCMSSAVAGYIQSFGADGPPPCYEDLELTDCAFIIGSNTADCHPIIFNRLNQHIKHSNAKMVVVDPRRTKTAEAADLHLAIKPGTDIDLLNGIAHLLLKWERIDTFFIDECTRDFSKFATLVQSYTPETVARRCGIRIDHLEQAAKYWAKANSVLSIWSMGINQSSEGTAKVRTLINLHLMTGEIGKPGAGPFSLTGQPNAMGGREAGGLAHLLPGYRLVKNPEHRQALEQAWDLPSNSISPVPGKDAWSMITGLETGDVGMLWVVATNPAVSMPDLERTKAALLKSEFTICQDAYYPTETANYSHLLLPALQWGEKTGTMTNSERVVTYCPQFRDRPGEAWADWEIFAEVGRRLGYTKQFRAVSSAEVYDEFIQLTGDRPCDMTGLSHERLATDGPIQWPCPASEFEEKDEKEVEKDNRGLLKKILGQDAPLQGKRLYTDGRFYTPDGRARFAAYHSRGLAEPPDTDFPFVLTIGRLYGHWHTMTRTGRIPRIMKMHPKPFLEIHPRDAQRLGVAEGEMIEVRSRRGSAKFPALITKNITPGTVFAPMHWGELWGEDTEANNLTHPESCPVSLQPELKACAVQVLKVRSPLVESQEDSQKPAEVLQQV
ncbi:assimilatory nitrate reductase (ferredoxin) precursor [[Leptolyngbya] sp. PCC 7376]|uniref:molybdopterin oxidoreductase family protein n=1 Tax=[Leptolyngbya] sp. PCC 7376 TaxID=111781 RepID=UPI00029ED0E9|nr:nitrate reductase [[Leptolyngbya] sp. PCC 7376]AFY37177.1 assimilatory nitrate reductase (ferredoxin) precursor [[Leptolyngbya] sp. PCC 7376]